MDKFGKFCINTSCSRSSARDFKEGNFYSMDTSGIVSNASKKGARTASGNRLNDVVKEVFYRVYYDYDDGNF